MHRSRRIQMPIPKIQNGNRGAARRAYARTKQNSIQFKTVPSNADPEINRPSKSLSMDQEVVLRIRGFSTKQDYLTSEEYSSIPYLLCSQSLM